MYTGFWLLLALCQSLSLTGATAGDHGYRGFGAG